jgi:hypothetical protein
MRIARMCTYGFGLLVVVAAVSASVLATDGGIGAPEIDAGSIVSGLGLLAGSVIILRARMRAK